MIGYALFARLDAKPGKEPDVAAFLAQALDKVNCESTTPIWFALRLSVSTFGIFDAFSSEGDALRLKLASMLPPPAKLLRTSLPGADAMKQTPYSQQLSAMETREPVIAAQAALLELDGQRSSQEITLMQALGGGYRAAAPVELHPR